jgi:hypothetical protein
MIKKKEPLNQQDNGQGLEHGGIISRRDEAFEANVVRKQIGSCQQSQLGQYQKRVPVG